MEEIKEAEDRKGRDKRSRGQGKQDIETVWNKGAGVRRIMK
jgi:hypothetical protein